jgi:hypothetical protein
VRPLLTIPFRACTLVVLEPWLMATVFPDGKRADAALDIDTDETRQYARAMGYSTIERMHAEHDVAHTLIAEARGLRWSQTLRHVAGGKCMSEAERLEEEGIVTAFQTWRNTGRSDARLAAIPDLVALRARLVAAGNCIMLARELREAA